MNLRSSQRWTDLLGMSFSRFFDGLRIEVFAADREADHEAALRRVEEALTLIKTHDPLRYNRLIHDLERVRVRLLMASWGTYSISLKSCDLDDRFVTDESISLKQIASTIVHEATHLRLHRSGIGYEEKLRARVEAVCIRRELAFASNLSNAEEVREHAEMRLSCYAAVPEYLSDAARIQRIREDFIERAREHSMPGWLISVMLAHDQTMGVLRRVRRRLFGIIRLRSAKVRPRDMKRERCR